MSHFWIFLGGGLGGIARFGASGFIARHFGETLPWDTFLVNVAGSERIAKYNRLLAIERELGRKARLGGRLWRAA
jgi:CrcB protein